MNTLSQLGPVLAALNIQIDFLEMMDSKGVIIWRPNQKPARFLKATILNKYMLDLILDPKFDENDYHYPKGKSLKQWIEDDLALKLKRYITSMEVKKKLEDEGSFIASSSSCSYRVTSYLYMGSGCWWRLDEYAIVRNLLQPVLVHFSHP